MEIITLALFILVGTGITNLVVNSTILDSLRDLIIRKAYQTKDSLGELVEKLLSCMMCSGFWLGMLVSLFFPINFIAAGIIISLTSHFYGTFIGGLEGLSELSDSVVVEDAEE
nr:hypothetical protein 9 [bacterium]